MLLYYVLFFILIQSKAYRKKKVHITCKINILCIYINTKMTILNILNQYYLLIFIIIIIKKEYMHVNTINTPAFWMPNTHFLCWSWWSDCRWAPYIHAELEQRWPSPRSSPLYTVWDTDQCTAHSSTWTNNNNGFESRPKPEDAQSK